MSAQKLVAEADKLLERGKYPEAIEKLKSAIAADPLNQLIATKLANAFVENEDPVSAKKVLVAAASRLSDAGKSQVAIAIYKQAIELAPTDIELRTKFALECESVGKVGDAVNSAQMVLKHYLQRKKYFDAANILPLIVRNQNKDEKMKFIWVEVMQLSQADQKLIHLLVALAGPPGLVSQEFPVGGEPTAMSENLYQAFKQLVDWFPSDAKIAYAVAWCAQKRGNEYEFHHYLRECMRREPDFCLGLLLFARYLAEKQKLTESLFIYKYLRERLGADRTVDMLTLTRLVESFVEKNGWITFTEGMMSAGEYSNKEFINAFLPQENAPLQASLENENVAPEAVAATEIAPTNINAKSDSKPQEEAPALPPTEIELSPPPAGAESSNGAMEIQLTSGEKIIKNPFEVLMDTDHDKNEIETYNPELTKIGTVASPASPEPALPPKEVSVQVPSEPTLATAATHATVQVHNEQHVIPAPENKIEQKTVLTKEVPEIQATAIIQESVAPAGYNPLISAESLGGEPENVVVPSGIEAISEKTVLFSPMEAVQATNQKKIIIDDPKTKIMQNDGDATVVMAVPSAIDQPPTPAVSPKPTNVAQAEDPAPAAAPAEQPTNITNNLHHSAILQSAPTVLYDPVEAVEAGLNSRRSLNANEAGQKIEPQAESLIAASPDAAIAPQAEVPQEIKKMEEAPSPFGAAFVPIPEVAAGATASAEEKIPAKLNDENVDLGDDLLEGPTRILTNLDVKDATAHLLNEIHEDSKSNDETLSPDILLKKAERYIAKRNYYLARKAVRHAHALGAEENLVKEKLREIRKLELPDGLYAAVSTDAIKDEGSKNLLEKLEEEFDLKNDTSADEIDQLKMSIKSNFEEIFKDSDPRTILDFGVGLHEMGLYKEAESFFIRMVNDHPEQSFDAYYLAAISKFARKDYAGAVSILKKLSHDSGRSEKDKISIYYTLGEVFEKMQQSERSKSFYEKVAALDSNYRNIRDKLEK